MDFVPWQSVGGMVITFVLGGGLIKLLDWWIGFKKFNKDSHRDDFRDIISQKDSLILQNRQQLEECRKNCEEDKLRLLNELTIVTSKVQEKTDMVDKFHSMVLDLKRVLTEKEIALFRREELNCHD